MIDVTSDTILEEMLEILSQPNSWCQGSFSKYSAGGIKQHCIIGAHLAAYSKFRMIHGTDFINVTGVPVAYRIELALDKMGYPNSLPSSKSRVACFNDEPTVIQEDIILLVKKALYDE